MEYSPFQMALMRAGTGTRALGEDPGLGGYLAEEQVLASRRRVESAQAEATQYELEQEKKLQELLAQIDMSDPQAIQKIKQIEPELGYKLERQLRESQTGMYGDAPAAVQEFQYFENLPNENARRRYMGLKRAAQWQDVGGEIVGIDPVTNQPSSTLPKTLPPEALPVTRFAQKQAEAEGTALAAISGEAMQLEASMPALEETIAEMDELAKTADYTMPDRGINYIREQWLGKEADAGSLAASTYESKLNNQVLPMLKPLLGSAFTLAEYEALQKTLGSPTATPKQKQAALSSFVAQTKRNLSSKQKEVGMREESSALRAQAQEAIAAGKSRAAVADMFKQMTGEDL
jgi:hypothetical protein